MGDWTFDRAAALGGIGFVVLAGTASAIAPTSMRLDRDVDEIRRTIADHADGLGASALLTALAMLALGCFIAYVHGRLTPAARGGSARAVTFALAGAAL